MNATIAGIVEHYRALSACDGDAFGESVEQVLGRHGTSLKVIEATSAFEVSPRVDWNKGSVVRLIYERWSPGGGLFYAGDSEGDREAMEVVAELGGLTVGVGPEAPSRPSRRLPDPTALSALLETLLHDLRESGRCG
ncbi:MAG TPA: hypothetical protein VJB14_03445 [Planctomycetota bacterium]|nr:hypothetical protein [Planctomycetota bacterium]